MPQRRKGPKKRPDGRWYDSVSIAGTRRYAYGKSAAEVRARMVQIEYEAQRGMLPPPERQSIAQYLTYWLEECTPRVKPATYANYESYVRLHLKPALGAHRLLDLQVQHVQAMMARKLADRHSERHVKHMRDTLVNALNHAQEIGLVYRNVAALAKPPRQQHREVQTIPPADVAAVLQTLRGHALEALYALAFATGARQGELLALRWQDIDREARAVTFRHTLTRSMALDTPKTGKARTVPVTPHILTLLKQRQVAQKVAPASGLVFTTASGRPYQHRNLIRHWHTTLRKCGLPIVPFHTIRHTVATRMLEKGIPAELVKQVLGHSTIKTTVDVYAHPNLASLRRAVNAIAVAKAVSVK